jgi:alkyldihydroxyacetonephosphate synthase
MSLVFEIDRESLLVRVAADVSVAVLEDALRAEGLTLGLDAPPPSTGVGEWIARGAPAAPSPYADPASHLVAGFVATSARSGEILRVKPSPRRSVGPDLFALVFGLGGRFFALSEAHLVVRRIAADPVREPHHVGGDPPLSEGEERLLAAIVGVL